MPKRTFHGGRSLLNKPGFQSTGALVAEIENTSKWKPGCNRVGKKATTYSGVPTSVLQFADCSRSINFDIDIQSAEEYENTLHKVDTMIDLLSKFRRGIVIERRRLETRWRAAGVNPADDDD